MGTGNEWETFSNAGSYLKWTGFIKTLVKIFLPKDRVSKLKLGIEFHSLNNCAWGLLDT